jgi:hypothetical protein
MVVVLGVVGEGLVVGEGSGGLVWVGASVFSAMFFVVEVLLLSECAVGLWSSGGGLWWRGCWFRVWRRGSWLGVVVWEVWVVATVLGVLEA